VEYLPTKVKIVVAPADDDAGKDFAEGLFHSTPTAAGKKKRGESKSTSRDKATKLIVAALKNFPGVARAHCGRQRQDETEITVDAKGKMDEEVPDTENLYLQCKMCPFTATKKYKGPFSETFIVKVQQPSTTTFQLHFDNFHSKIAAKKGGKRPLLNLATLFVAASTKFVDFSGVDGKQVHSDDGSSEGLTASKSTATIGRGDGR
jgi:hypothetical protein